MNVPEHRWRKIPEKIALPLEHQHEGMQRGAHQISSQVLRKTARTGIHRFW